MNLRTGIELGIAGALVVGTGVAMYDCGKKASDDKVAGLATQLAQSEKTIELKDGLYATKIVEMTDLKNLLDGTS